MPRKTTLEEQSSKRPVDYTPQQGNKAKANEPEIVGVIIVGLN